MVWPERLILPAAAMVAEPSGSETLLVVSVELCSVTGPPFELTVMSGPAALPPPGVLFVVLRDVPVARDTPPDPALSVSGPFREMFAPCTVSAPFAGCAERNPNAAGFAVESVEATPAGALASITYQRSPFANPT